MEEKIARVGQELFDAIKGETASIFRRDYWNGKVMDWCMKNPDFKLNMFRFVDVLPVLQSDRQIADHLQGYLCGEGEDIPAVLKWGITTAGATGVTAWIAAKSVRKNVASMARMFIPGTDAKDAFDVYAQLRKQRLCFTVDILGEKVVCEKEARQYQDRYIELFHSLKAESGKWEDDPLLDTDHTGPIPKVNVSVKPSSLSSRIYSPDFNNSVKVLRDSLRPIFQAAKATQSFVNIDMESYGLKDITLRAFTSLLEEDEFKQQAHVGIVIQTYLKSAQKDMDYLIQWCKKKDRPPVTIRLVKGAYWDYEVITAKQRGWPVPVFTTKAHSDANFEDITRRILRRHDLFGLAIASHNIRSIANAIVLAEELKIPNGALEIQMLYGMAEPIKKAVTNMGYRCRDYAPVGELIPGMGYLVRRLLENTSNESFLRLKFTTDTPTRILLQSPGQAPVSPELIGTTFPPPGKQALEQPFVNAPCSDFILEEPRELYKKALKKVQSGLGWEVTPHINGKRIKSKSRVASVNPCRPDEVVAQVCSATKEDVAKALDSAWNAKEHWAKLPVEERSLMLLRTAELLRKNWFELCALETMEVGKSWREADADIAEAVDFCEYYARMAVELFSGKKLMHISGEDNRYFYRPKGVGVVIAPWNFPMAIPVGMTSAALVAGNPVVFKPATQSAKIGERMYEIFIEAGCPKEVLQFITGPGSVVGPPLVGSAKTSFIIFTGSKDVGTEIIENAAKPVPDMTSPKRVVAEMGGKNALIVDEDADVDEAVAGAIKSAFGFQGQKCSAMSRLIIHEAIYDRFMDRFREAIGDLLVCEASDPNCDLSAVVDKASYDRINRVIDETRNLVERVTQGSLPEGLDPKGYYIPPTVFEGVPRDSTVAVSELFGPVVAVFKVKTIEEAVDLANSVPYALTGGAFSRRPYTIEYLKKNLEVGNIYINRNITGAIVGRHPFGGYKLSGVGSKAGGPDYLLQFVDPVTSVENTLRRGFAPDFDM
ncbi:MAG TPA: proline dehydrogenase family protein [Deltaproteobacteria bacterium]|nr:proline dehydrogenase family protein [Deltaproteobacteria bacterium]